MIVAAIAAALIFANLGSGYLWADEGDTAVLAHNIVKFGLPRAWDGKTFMDSDFGARVNHDLVMVSSPWLQYYVAAASFALFGENTFSARFPFALAGWLTIVVAYRLIWMATRDRRAALCGSVLVIASVQFLLFCRQSRYYALAMLLTCLLIESFLKMRSIGRATVFGIVSVMLFHTHPIGIVPIIAVGALTLIDPNFSAQRRWYWLTLPAILALTTPWFLLAQTGYTENAVLVTSVRDFFLRLVQYLIECASVTPLIGIVVVFLFIFWAQPTTQRFQQSERALLVTVVATVISLALGV
jgi:4-amino-4-deoxy-L-arabinose transferase-like glycosyltransferase